MNNECVNLIKTIGFYDLAIGIIISLILLWIVFFLTNQNFRRIDSYLSILREASFVGVAAIGMTFCIIIKAIDFMTM